MTKRRLTALAGTLALTLATTVVASSPSGAAAVVPPANDPFYKAPANLASKAPAACQGTHWVASWTAAPSDAFTSLIPLRQTLRQTVYPHQGGRVTRIHLSNKFGIGPVTFGAASIGVSGQGATVKSGTSKPVLFKSKGGVTIPAGGSVVSDPVAITFKEFQTLSVSLYVKSAIGQATEHVFANQTSYQSLPLSGDHTSDTSASAFVISTPLAGVPVPLPQAIYYLSGLDVVTPRSVGTVVAFGDSITDGFQGAGLPVVPSGAQVDRASRYPDALARRIKAAKLPLSVVNAGISGNALLSKALLPIFGVAGLERFDADALDQAGVRTVILMEGINDIGLGASASALITGYKNAINRAHARGVRLIIGTLTPDEGTIMPGYGATAEPTRDAVNTWVRAQHLSDGIVDFDTAVRDPSHPTRILPTYDGSDHLHFTAAGYQAMANAIPLRLLNNRKCV